MTAAENELIAPRKAPATEQKGIGHAGASAHAQYAIKEIDAALLRLTNDQYGTCLACGRRIAVERLQLLPATRFCLRCARKRRHAR